jgi:hypothetical protein
VAFVFNGSCLFFGKQITMLNYPNDQPTQGTVINETAKYNLLEAARWGKFLAVVGFVTMGLMIAVGLFMGAFMATISAAQGGYPLSPAFFAVSYVSWRLFTSTPYMRC